ncbi:hypothetical protein [Ruixingdingia sedimenti]|uniref:DUF2190 family protein n=1 Tax=Ruixingdingia sedimenti TaxID=3073604 RepID=A0ABU1FFA5_9RHOB|nr:hypothetical protein [Xinfangfangia sp. LG-4]MDR5655551.1 hypothetical protein [Xinfangfangia sp. LG-4]
MQHFQDILTISVTTTGTFGAYDLVSYAGAKVTTADAQVLGVAKSPNTVIGDQAAVLVMGVARVKAVGAITAGSGVVSAAAGGVKQAAEYDAGPPIVPADVNIFATALNTAADGEFVSILLR